jgi:hypothetical protein
MRDTLVEFFLVFFFTVLLVGMILIAHDVIL